MPAGALEFVVMIAITYVCLRLVNIRTWCMTAALSISLMGSIMVFAAPYSNKAALLCGYYFVRLRLSLPLLSVRNRTAKSI